jgi:hypothetical protein
MSQAEKNSILDKHKTIYDGYVTQYGQQSNTQPLYVQDYANDKEGMVVSNKGVVKPYTNMGINESTNDNITHKAINNVIDSYLNEKLICDKKYIMGDNDPEEFLLYASGEISEILFQRFVKHTLPDEKDEDKDTERRYSYEDKLEEIVRVKYGNKIKKYFIENVENCPDRDNYEPMDKIDYDDVWDTLEESHTGSDMIGDGGNDLKNGTVDLDDLMGYPSPNEDEFDYISLGMLDDSELEEGFDDFDIKRKRGGIDYNEKEFPGTNKYKVDIEDLNFGDFLEPKRDDSNQFDLDYEEVDEEHGTFDHMSDEYDDDDLNYGSMKRNYYNIDDTMPIIPDFEDEVDEDVLPEFMEKLNESLDMFKRFKKYN